MTALALAAAELKRVTRDRTFLFFLVVLPILVILLVGLTTASRHQHSHCRGGGPTLSTGNAARPWPGGQPRVEDPAVHQSGPGRRCAAPG